LLRRFWREGVVYSLGGVRRKEEGGRRKVEGRRR
jgi:hypothetical protein